MSFYTYPHTPPAPNHKHEYFKQEAKRLLKEVELKLNREERKSPDRDFGDVPTTPRIQANRDAWVLIPEDEKWRIMRERRKARIKLMATCTCRQTLRRKGIPVAYANTVNPY